MASGAGDHLDATEWRLRSARIRRHGPQSTPGRREVAIGKGKDGERLLGAILEAAPRRQDIELLHSLVRPRRLGDIDHIVVGPAGVSVIDAKNWSGRVTVSKGTLWNGRYNKQPALDGVTDQVAEIESVLAAHGRAEVPIQGFLCLVAGNAGVPQSLVTAGAVRVGLPPAVIAESTRAGLIDIGTRGDIAGILRAAYRQTPPAVAGEQPLVIPAEWTQVSVVAKPVPSPATVRRGLHPATRWFFALLSAALVLATLGSLDARAPSTAPMARAELNRHLLYYGQLARVRAHRTVRGPHVAASAREYRLVYRGGRHCRVLIDVPRGAGHVVVRSHRCRSR